MFWKFCNWHGISGYPSVSTSKNTQPILIIDDDAFARYSLQMSLKKAGFEVMEVEMGPRALVLLRVYRPAIVLCAVRQGMREGLPILRRLQARQEGGNYSLLLLTSEVDRSRLPVSCEGIEEFVLLPVDEGGLAETLRKYDPASTADRRGMSRIEESSKGGLGAYPDSSKKYLRFHAFSLELERRAKERAAHPGPVPRVHSNQIGVVGALAAARMGRGPNLNCYLDKGFLALNFDELQVIVSELIENACRHSDPQAGIDLFFLKEESGDEIYVRDHGRGMSSEKIKSIAAFSAGRSDAALTFDREAEGFGLPMVRLIAEKRGGSFWVSSTVGVGTTVRIQLPTGIQHPGTAGGKSGDMGIPPLNFD